MMDLPPCIMDIIADYLMLTRAEVLSHARHLHADILEYGEIYLPGDDYKIRDITEYINNSRERYFYGW